MESAAPAGLSEDINLKGICAEVENDAPMIDDLAMATDFETFANYQGVEDSAPPSKDTVTKGISRSSKTWTHLDHTWGQSPYCPNLVASSRRR